MKKVRILFVFTCLFFLIGTLVGTVIGLPTFDKVNENRKRSIFPSPRSLSLKEPIIFFNRIQRSFDDNFFTRDFLIRLTNTADYFVFRESQGVYFGKSGFISYKDTIDNQQVANERMGETGLLELYSELIEIRNFLSEHGVSLVILIPQQMNSIFPEMFPDVNVHRPSPTMYQRLLSKLDSGPLKNSYVDLGPSLRQAAGIAPPFFRTNFHWNDFGAAIGYKVLVDKMGIDQFGHPLWTHPIVPKPVYEYFGGEEERLALLFVHTETAYSVVNTFQQDYQRVSSIFPVTGHSVNNSSKELLLPTVVVGDSYSANIFDRKYGDIGMAQYYRELSHVDWQSSKGLLKRLPAGTKTVVLEFIEASLHRIEPDLLNLLSD